MAGLNLTRRRTDTTEYSYVLNPADPRFRRAVKKAILGSAIEVDDGQDVTDLRLAARPWQLEALGYRQRLGEIRYASDFYARPLRRLKFYVGEIQTDGEIERSENEQAQAILARVRDPGGGTQGLLTQYGRLMFCTGEALLLYTPEQIDEDDGTTSPECWEMMSTAELRPQSDDTLLRFPFGGSGTGGQQLPEGSTTYRLWQRDPMFSQLADAPMRAVLELCEELAILTLVVRARAISRLAGNGILFVPNEITLPPRAGTVGDENPEEDPFLEELIKTLLAPIEDQGSASAAVPLLVRGPADAGDKIKHIAVRDPSENFPENQLREQTIKRLGYGLDMPAEVLTGVTRANHWSAWMIERDAWRHAEPVARQYVDDMTNAYLRPALVAEGIADPERYVIVYDASEILTNPDRGTDANDAFDRGAIGYEAFRGAMGWSDEDAPEPDEIDVMLEFLGKGANQQQQQQPGAAPTTTAPADAAPAGGQPDDSAPNAPDESASLIPVLLGAAEFAVQRHREVAGARIRRSAVRCDPCREAIDGVPNSLVAATLGKEAVEDLGVAAAATLVSAREAMFTTTASRFKLAAPVAAALSQLVEHHAARTLYDQEPQPFPESAMRAILERSR